MEFANNTNTRDARRIQPFRRKDIKTPFFQPKLTVGQSDSVYEKEADAVADRVMRMENNVHVQPKISALPVHRKCAHCEEEEHVQRKENDSATVEQDAPDIVSDALNTGGNPMDHGTQSFMESRFGHDFGNVKIHNDTLAAKSADSINALAYTNGSDIVFNAGQYSPGSDSGKRLLAHELTHVVQQGGGGSLNRKIQRQDIDVDIVEASYEEALSLHNQGIDLPTVGTPPPVVGQTYQEGTGRWNSQTTGRRPRRATTKRAPGFTGDTGGTHIRRIDVQIHPHAMSVATLTWANMGNSPGYTLPHTLNVSPGAGNCTSDCSDAAQSQTDGSHCTPIGDFTVQGFADNLPGDSAAKYVTWYHRTRGIAFHYYNVPSFPASHGCTRMDEGQSGAEWIYDNSLAGVTAVSIHRDPSEGQGDCCWRGGVLTPRTPPRRGEPNPCS